VSRVYTVYKGSKNNKILYIGTTIQVPKDRFRWHKHNGKNLNFEVLFQYNNENEMLDKEFELIKKYNPKLNKIKHRRQNLNAPLSKETIESRIGNTEWCQFCLKRRVNVGYKYCMYCS
jgi:DNA polymerase elongation subunit (family B)